MNHDLVFPRTIEKWDEAIPLGNGKIGTLIWGKADELRFSLDRTDIWDRTPPAECSNKDFTYSHLVELAKAGKTKEIRDLFDAPYQRPLPTKLPAGKLLFHFRNGYNVKSQLKLEEAAASLEIETETGKIQLQAFCHGSNEIGMINIAAPLSEFSYELVPVQYGNKKSHGQSLGECASGDCVPGKCTSDEVASGEHDQEKYDPDNREISQGSINQLFYEKAQKNTEKDEKLNQTVTWFTQPVDKNFSYGIVAGCKEYVEKTVIFYKVVTSQDGENWIEDGKNQIKKELETGFDANFKTHKEWWNNYWNKSRISLPDEDMEKQWYITNYLFGSCSRKGCYPMPLQGVWTADDGNLPPWKGDYHNDLNTQFSYSHFYKANHLEEGESFIDFLWNLRGEAKNFAKKFYGAEGICFPGVMTIDGKPLGGWPMYSLSPVHQIWLCQSFIEYYRYTGNEDFLKNKMWPFCKETGVFISSILEKKADGLYYLPVSSSPEIHDDEQASWLKPNSNYDLSLLIYLFRNLVYFADKLELKKEKEHWQEYLDNLPPLAINDKNVLMLSPDESLNESHRHLSNSMAIYPLYLYDYNNEKDKEIIDSTILDYERLGTGYWVGFSFPWMSHLYSIQGNGEGAYAQLKIFWECFCSPNGFHLNGDYKKRGITTFHYRPFTLEANMLAADGLQEMLFQMRNGEISLFPAIPEKWKTGKVSFNNFRGERGLLVSACLENGKVISCNITAVNNQSLIIKGPNGIRKEVQLLKNERKYFSKEEFI